MTLKLHLLRFIFRWKKPGVVFYGHNVTDHIGPKFIPSLHLKPSEFENTILRFKTLDFDFISMDQLIELSRSRFKHRKPWLHITFDDGYQDNLDVILPIIRKHQIPITVFVSSNHIATKSRFYTHRIKRAMLHTEKSFSHKQWELRPDATKDERLVFYRAVMDDVKLMPVKDVLAFMHRVDDLLDKETEAELDASHSCDEVMDLAALKQLASDPLVTIGSHNHDHVIMNENVTDDEIEYQMATSQSWIEQNLSTECASYCYPNGQEADFTERSKAVCKRYYTLAFTTLSGFIDQRTDPYEIPRMFLLPDCISIIHRMAFPAWIFRLRAKLKP